MGWEAGISFHRRPAWGSPAITLWSSGPQLGRAGFSRDAAGRPSCGDFLGKGTLASSLYMSATLGHRAAALNPPALGAGREAQGNGLAEVSRASYLPKPACSHKSQNRVPGRDVNSEMQRQLQRKTVERNRPGSCLLSPQVSEGSLEQARAFGGHCPRYHPPSLRIDLKLCQLRLYERARLRLCGGKRLQLLYPHPAPEVLF